MSSNQDICRVFDQMAAGLEILGANRFRVNAYAKASRVIDDLTDDLRAIVEEDPPSAVKRLTEFDGIGKGMAEKIAQFVETGSMEEHREMLEKVPVGLFDILEIPGIGPKAARAMWDQLGIGSLEELENTSDEALASLPRMGKKTVDNIRQAIEFNKRSGGRVQIGLAQPIAIALRDEIAALEGVTRVEYAGSLRRGRETIGDLDFLVSCQDTDLVREAFTGHPWVTQVLAKGETKCSVRLEKGQVIMQADLRLVPEEVYGAALMYFTGSKEHNVRLREVAIRQGKHLNEYGLFEGTAERPQESGAEPLAAIREEEIYRELGLAYIPPEMREDRGELERAGRGELDLIELRDVRAELHAHTTASDGRLSIDELAEEARSRGFHTLAVTDHSKSSVIAGGLQDDELRRHIAAVREANERIEGITVLAGSEVDILTDGSLDYDDDLLAELDVVVASPHAALRQDPDTATERLLRAIRHPLVHILGHPTGRIINKREGLSPDMAALIEAAVECDTALELNANWHRLDLRDSHLRSALAAGCKIAIDTDAHDSPHFDFLSYGVLTARRAGMAADSCINTWDADRLRAWLRSKRP
ncbi:MAG: DNA polymerase/3'-5' exonuclease PolX [Acidobacteriota bacterium]